MILSHDVFAMNASAFSQVLARSILWKNSLNAKVTPSNRNMHYVPVCVDSFECILINVYMTCDSSSNLNEYVQMYVTCMEGYYEYM